MIGPPRRAEPASGGLAAVGLNGVDNALNDRPERGGEQRVSGHAGAKEDVHRDDVERGDDHGLDEERQRVESGGEAHGWLLVATGLMRCSVGSSTDEATRLCVAHAESGLDVAWTRVDRIS